MHSDLKYKIFLLICFVLLTSLVVVAQGNSRSGPDIVFPEVAGWEKGDINTYPTKELGRSIVYRSREGGGTLTIYVYNGGFKKIADGIDDINVKGQIKQAGNDIKEYGAKGYYNNVVFIKSGTVTLGGYKGTVQALYSLFTFEIRGTAVDSEIYLFGYKNNFIKIRATRPKGEYSADNIAVHKFLLEVGKIFVK
jgi:hypothetical protein